VERESVFEKAVERFLFVIVLVLVLVVAELFEDENEYEDEHAWDARIFQTPSESVCAY
jgi:hypothetical protein